MAVYNNREVSIVGVADHSRITIQYKDMTHSETVSINQVKFTQEEKDNLIKTNPSVFDNVTVISEDDLKAVRNGVAPSYDPSYRQRAEEQVVRNDAQKIDQANLDKAKAEVEKERSDRNERPTNQHVVNKR